jgi:RNA polymerase sigma-70 factor (ECF subfamily)
MGPVWSKPFTQVAVMATEEIWSRFSSSLRSFIHRRVSNDHDADDILQSVFLKIHQKVETINDPTAVAAWVYQIARNSIADYYRHRKATEALDNEIAIPHEEENLNSDMGKCLTAMVDDLPEPFRTAIEMVEQRQMMQRDYAATAGLSLSGAKSRIQRARKMLKKKLLDCCSVELDRLGNVLDFRHKNDSYKHCTE